MFLVWVFPDFGVLHQVLEAPLLGVLQSPEEEMGDLDCMDMVHYEAWKEELYHL